MKHLLLIFLFTTLSLSADTKLIQTFLENQKLDENGSFNGAEGKSASVELSIRSQPIVAVVDYVHVVKNQWVISLHTVRLIKSRDPLTLAMFPVYSTHLLTKPELEKRGQKFQSYGAISSEEGNGLCRAAFGPEFHVAKQNPTSARKTEIDPWYLAALTCEGPRFVPPT